MTLSDLVGHLLYNFDSLKEMVEHVEVVNDKLCHEPVLIFNPLHKGCLNIRVDAHVVDLLHEQGDVGTWKTTVSQDPCSVPL